jgi:hypothetical protein
MEPQLVRREVGVRIAHGAGMDERRELKRKFGELTLRSVKEN